MIDDAGQEIELGMWYRLLEEKQDLLTEVKRLREGIKRMAEICEGNSNPYLSDALKEMIE